MHIKKDNTFNPSYTGRRDDILTLIPDKVKKVLDVGCSIGALGEQIKQRNHAEVVGIEIDAQMAHYAEEKLDRVVVGDIETINLQDYLVTNYFDCIIFADILEHLKNPWEVLKNTIGFLSDNGVVIASIPNIRHYTVIVNLLFRGDWPYRKRGIYDKAHLRFFTLKKIKEMFRDSVLEIIKIERHYRIIEKPHRFSRCIKYCVFPPFREFLAFRYAVIAKKAGALKT
ncbi:MAG: class I SAM-dependent methyltransferase [Thermodesulfobacteriota bacterium]